MGFDVRDLIPQTPKTNRGEKLEMIEPLRNMEKEKKERIARYVASRACERLFHNGAGQEAERLVLWLDSNKKDIGGWCKTAVAYQIYEAIMEQLPDSLTPRQ
jgi:hypothetical protein